MLKHLRVKNFITLLSYEADFHDGLTVFTGESGAGKSVLFTALYCILGKPFLIDYIRNGESYSECEAIFSISHLKDPFLNELTDHDDQLIIYRKQTKEKQQKIKINTKNVSQKTLKQIALKIAIIVNQHEQLTLTQSSYQLELLDSLNPETSSLKKIYKKNFDTYKVTLESYNELKKLSTDLPQYEFLNFKHNDIAKHEFTPNEEDELRAQKKEIVAQKTVQDSFHALTQTLTTAQQALFESTKTLDSLKQTAPNSLDLSAFSDLNSLYASLDELSFQSSKQEQKFSNTNHPSLSDISFRLELILSYLSKYNVLSLHQLCELQKNLANKIQMLESAQVQLNELESKLNSQKQSCLNEAKKIQSSRKKSALSLCKHIEASLKNMEFAAPQLHIQFNETPQLTESGIDQIEFQLSLEPSAPLKSLSEVASGGELSRLLLAFYAFVSQQKPQHLFLFDEIDTGVGGLTANTMGQLLQDMAKSQQIFCITHLAQIATCANQHITLTKTQNSDGIITTPTYLATYTQQDEIKRMLGGEHILNSVQSLR